MYLGRLLSVPFVVNVLSLLVIFQVTPYPAYAEVALSKPYVQNIAGETIMSLGVDSQALLQVDMENMNDEPQPYVVLMEVRDSDDVTIYLQFQKGQLAPESSTQVGISWIVDSTGDYQVRSFVLSDFNNPVIISPTTVHALKVGQITELATSIDTVQEEAEQDQTTIYPDKAPTLQNLRNYALSRINEDRAVFGLEPVELSSNLAAQVHAEDVLKTRYISHWMSNGEKPYMTYTKYGGLGDVAQNVATSGDYYYYKDCTSGLFYCEIADPYEQIDLHQYGMVYDDKECCDDGHRDNILDRYHTHVSIGIAYDDYTFVLVQNFENNYIEFDEPIAKDDKNVRFAGELPRGTDIYGIYVYYDELPTEETYEENKDRMSYDSGELVAGVTTADYYYENISTITADRWSGAGNSIDIAFSIEPITTERGVYTVVMILEDSEGNTFAATSYSIRVVS